jgi:hypothetical protein
MSNLNNTKYKYIATAKSNSIPWICPMLESVPIAQQMIWDQFYLLRLNFRKMLYQYLYMYERQFSRFFFYRSYRQYMSTSDQTLHGVKQTAKTKESRSR